MFYDGEKCVCGPSRAHVFLNFAPFSASFKKKIPWRCFSVTSLNIWTSMRQWALFSRKEKDFRMADRVWRAWEIDESLTLTVDVKFYLEQKRDFWNNSKCKGILSFVAYVLSRKIFLKTQFLIERASTINYKLVVYYRFSTPKRVVYKEFVIIMQNREERSRANCSLIWNSSTKYSNKPAQLHFTRLSQ